MDLGERHGCGLTTAHLAVCWGADEAGQTQVPAGLGTLKQISAGGAHTCAITSDDTLACWGLDGDGQATPPAGTYKNVDTGGHHSCAIRLLDNVAVCWGRTYGGDPLVPPSVQALPVTGIATGASHTCAIADDVPVCWGADDAGQSTVPMVAGATQIYAAADHSCSIISSDVTCWGSNTSGESTPPPGGQLAVSLALGAHHTCNVGVTLRRSFGTGGGCWGADDAGQSTLPSNGAITDNVVAGGDHTCSLHSGVPVCWGTSFGEGVTLPAPTYTRSATTGAATTLAVDFTGNPSSRVAVTGGALPPGLSLDAETATLGGTPTAAGTYTGTLTIADGYFPDATWPFSITVSDPPPPPPPPPAASGVFGRPVDPLLPAAPPALPAPAATQRATASVVGRTITLRPNVRVACPTTSRACTVTITAMRKRQALGSRVSSLKPGRGAKPSLTLSAVAVAKLPAGRKVRLNVRVTLGAPAPARPRSKTRVIAVRVPAASTAKGSR